MTADFATFYTAAVSRIFDIWPILQAALREEWGGHDTLEKAEWMKETISEYILEQGDKIDILDIEDVLFQIMQDEFNAEVDDGSIPLIAKDIKKIYDEIKAGADTPVLDRINAIHAAWKEKQANKDNESNTCRQDEPVQDTVMEDVETVKSEVLPNQQGPEIDEDGFQVVRRSRKKR